MKTDTANHRFVIFTLITILIVLGVQRNSYSQNLNVGEPRTVRMIYFLPNDLPFRADVIQNMKDAILKAQTFYADQMQVHGYGTKTFQFETDAKGEPKVHRVNGQHPFAHYDNTLGTAVLEELRQTFDLGANIYFIVLGADALRQGNGQPAEGVGHRRGKNGGDIVVPNEFTLFTVAHELGHTFGLGHDFRDDSYIMSYGNRQDSTLSACAAEFLFVSPYFNTSIPIAGGPPPTIELISSPTYPSGAKSILVRLKVKAAEEIHQVQLFSLQGLQAYRGLAGKKEAIVEFEYNGIFEPAGFISLSDAAAHNIFVQAVDTDGNVGFTRFTLAEMPASYITTFEGQTGRIHSVSFSPDGGTLASASGNTVMLWEIATGANIATFKSSAYSIAFSPDGEILVSGGRDGLKLWDVATGRNVATLSQGLVRSVAFSPDGMLLASGGDNIELWDMSTRRNIATMGRKTELTFKSFTSVSFSPDGTTLASGSEYHEIKLWDVATRRNIATMVDDPPVVLSVSFSPDGTTLASSGGFGGIKLWDVATRRNMTTLSQGIVLSVAFLPDRMTLASGHWGGEVGLWDVATGSQIDAFAHASQQVLTVAFSPDETILASGDEDGTVNLWDVGTILTQEVAQEEVNTEGDLAAAGPKIEGPWLWMLVPTDQKTEAKPSALRKDHLAAASNGAVTEAQIATEGAAEGDRVGNRVWTLGKLSPISRDNMNEMANTTRLGKGYIDYHIAYGSIVLDSPQEQNTWMYAGSDDNHKVWLNGALVHEQLNWYWAHDYQESFPVTLRKGKNVLLVAVEDGAGAWSGFFGFETDAVYRILPPPLREDVNKDNIVNILDLTFVAAHFGKQGEHVADVNGDNIVNILDLTRVAAAFGNAAAAPEAAGLHPNTPLTRALLQQWLQQAHQLNRTDATFQRGILILEKLLATLTPKETILLPNYPNPFNPETWIPYELAKAAEVTVSIYATDGKLVRTLALGHLPAGVYQSRHRAAYWDGKNETGESVASGTYFYQLQADHVSMLRKMVILK